MLKYTKDVTTDVMCIDRIIPEICTGEGINSF